MKFLPVGVEFCHKGRRTGLEKLIVAICFLNAYKSGIKQRVPTTVDKVYRQQLLHCFFNRTVKGKTIKDRL
jgi:hypothetical protein